MRVVMECRSWPNVVPGVDEISASRRHHARAHFDGEHSRHRSTLTRPQDEPAVGGLDADYDERALTVAGLGHVALDAAAGDLTDVGGRLPDSGRFTDAANVAVYGTSSSLPT